MLLFHLEEAVNSLSRFMSSQKCSETTGSPRYSYRHYYKESLLGTAVRALFQLRHLYDCTKKAITDFCTESIVATIASGSKTEETMHFCFFVVLPPQGQIGLTELLASNGQSICLLRQNQ